MDFLLSLSTKAKEKLAKTNLPENLNKSVMYADQVLSEDDVSELLLFPSTSFHSSILSASR
jgi:hypothetical protein